MISKIFTTSLSDELAGSSIDDTEVSISQSKEQQHPALASLESLIARRKWNRIRSLLDTDHGLAIAEHATRDVLHILYASDPPLDIATDLLGLCGDRVREKDSTGRTPLHFATASGAPVEVVEPLISMYPAAAGLPDCRGETPLMLASAHGKNADKSLVKALIRASPHTVIDEDDEGMSALEYALLSEVPRDIFRMLQKSCAKVRKRQAEKAREQKAAEAQEKLAQLSSRKSLLADRRVRFAQEIHSETKKHHHESSDSGRSLTGPAA
mmetsp:Transcript_19741/g.42512  ORF Transcript_19741/g.42512 Transcript_19741/m.42512 type:complete len:268 (-) Transcript_19741:111-914(-)